MFHFKRFFIGLFVSLCIGTATLGLSSCNGVTISSNDQGITITPNNSASIDDSSQDDSESSSPNDSDSSEHVHAWEEETVVTKVSCETAGVSIFTCECGNEKVQTTPALGHDRMRVDPQAPLA